MGIGMTNLAKDALPRLHEIGAKVPIHFLMLDPKVLETELDFSKKLETFLDFPDFTANARQAYRILRAFCVEWNAQPRHKHRMQFRVYNTIPTMSMVMIDPSLDSGEIEFEFFLYQSGEFRPRITVIKLRDNESLFNLLKDKFELLWKRSKRVV